MAKKNEDYNANKIRLIEGGLGDNPKLMARSKSDGRENLFLEYYFGYCEKENKDGKLYKRVLRKNEKLGLFLWLAPRNPMERQHNKETLHLAKKIRYEKSQQLLEDKQGYRIKSNRHENLLIFFQEFADQANVKDKLVLKGALKNFKCFLTEEYPFFSQTITSKNLDKEMIEKFVNYLVNNHKGQGAETYYRRFKRMVNYAVEKGVIEKSPCKGITIPKVDDILSKDILSAEELKLLFATHYEGQNPEIRRAFAMTCMSGIRRCDLVRLTYSNVDYANRQLKYRQSKTQKHSGSSGVVVPLNDALLAIIGKKSKDALDDYIFHIPSDTMCLRSLRIWTKKAGIQKHITWHCGRHSFATLLLSNGANIKTVSSLLGHSTLKFTEIYVRAVDKLKKEALDTLPDITI